LLGSPSENIWYTVSLKPGLKKADGSDAFGGAFGDGYAWDFEVSTFVDVTPPKVESVIPDAGVTEDRNILVQVNFDEAMDPTTVAGKNTVSGGISVGFNKITVTADGSPVAGTWAIGNQYKTIEFTTDFRCGTNSCGGDVYCLPENADIEVTVKAARLGTTPPEAEMPYTGATDVVGNSLDGDGNDTAEGPATDNYVWDFSTNNEINLIPPRIEGVTPGPPSSIADWPAGINNVSLDAPIEMSFDKVMSITSFTSENIILDDNEQEKCAIWFTNGGANFNRAGDGKLVTKAIIYHGEFIESTEALVPAPTCDGEDVDEQLVQYFPRATHRIKDIYQNCFFTPPTAGPQGPAGGTTCTDPVGAGCTWDVE
ncbi:MAG: Ig-like domain-containing protein, partial [Patescibacteria group bacterium]